MKRALACVALAALTGCSAGRYVWVHDLREPRAADDYVIEPGDLVGVRVFNQETMSTRTKVRSDGMITVPLLGDVEVRGRTPRGAASEIAARFKEYIASPKVTITVEEARPTSISVIGEVARPGIYALEPSPGVLSALAAAGGLTEFASKSSIYVVRRASAQRIRFTFSALARGEARAATFCLHTGDVVVVE